MNTIGIGITVDSQQVQDAKRHLIGLNDELKETHSLSKMKLELTGMGALNTKFDALTAELKNFRGFSLSSPTNHDMQGASGGIKEYASSVVQARQEMVALAKEQRQIFSMPQRSHSAQEIQNTLNTVTARSVAAARSGNLPEAERLNRHKRKLEQTLARTEGSDALEDAKQKAREQGWNDTSYVPSSRDDSERSRAESKREADTFWGQAGITTDEDKAAILKKQKGLNKEVSHYGAFETTTGAGAMLQEAKAATSVLGGIKGGRKGLITPEQAEEAKRLYASIQAKLKDYRKEIDYAVAAVDKLAARKKELETLSVADRTKDEQKEFEGLQKKIERLQAQADLYRSRHDATAGKVGRDADAHSERISGYHTSPAGADGAGMLKKALGYGLAAAGGFSILGFLGSSRSKYQESVGRETSLQGRGISHGERANSAAVSLGMGPLDFMSLKESMSQQGLDAAKVQRASLTAASFGKAHGIDPSQVAGMYGQMYQATGKGETGTGVLGLIEGVKKGMDKARISEMMQLVSRNTAMTAQAMGGGGADANQVTAAFALASNALKMQKDGKDTAQFAKSDDFAAFMQNGLQEGGSPMENVINWKLAGGLDQDKGPMTAGRLWAIKKKQQEGFVNDPDLLMEKLKLLGGTKQSHEDLSGMIMMGTRLTPVAAGKMATMAQDGKDGKASTLETLIADMKSLKKGNESLTSQQALDKLAKGGNAAAKDWQKEFGGFAGSDKQKLEAIRETVHIDAGEKLNELFGNFETGALNLTHALLDGNWKGAFDTFSKAAKDMGPVATTLVGIAGTFYAASKLQAAGGAMSFMGGAMSMGGKGGALLPALMGPAGVLGALGLGYGITYAAFKDGAQGANYLPEDRKNAITGKAPIGETAFAGKLNSKIANDPKYSKGYKDHAVSIYEAAKKWSVPENILAGLIESESDFTNVKPRQINLKNGKKTTVGGVAQFTEETAKQYKIDRMKPTEAIDGAAHLLSDIYKRTGDWRGAIKGYKGVESESNMYQVDTAIKKADKYTDTEAERQALKPTASDNTMQMLTNILQVIAGHSEQTALNTGSKPWIATPLAVGH